MGRRYELNGFFSKKFEELELRGAELITRAGKKGSEPAPVSRTFGSPLEAAQQYLARVETLEKEKYLRVFSEAQPAPLAHNRALEDALRAGGDAQAWAVYADWVQSQGHLIGELAAVQQRADPVVAKAFWMNCEDAILGELAALTLMRSDFKPPLGELEWEHGFLRHARLGFHWEQDEELAERATKLLRLPVARFLTRLTFGPTELTIGNDDSEIIDALINAEQAQRIESLFLGDFLEPDEHQMSWSGLGNVSRVWELKGLKHLRLRGGETATLGDIRAPNLESFIRESGGLAGSEWQSILSAQWPKLQKLEVWTGDDGYGAELSLETLQPLFAGWGLGKLRHLGLRNCQLTNALIPALATSAVLKQLEVLDLSLGTMDDIGVRSLTENARHFQHLKKLDLTENLISANQIAGLKALFPNAVLEPQREVDPGEPEFRFVAVSE